MTAYTIRIPGRILLLVEATDALSVFNHPADQIPPEFDLVIDLFRLKQFIIRDGVNRMNARKLKLAFPHNTPAAPLVPAQPLLPAAAAASVAPWDRCPHLHRDECTGPI